MYVKSRRRRWTRILVAALTTMSVVPAAALIAAGTATPASAETNGVGLKPAMGWSTWSFLRDDPTEA
jgi:alpha-galactosidase